MTVEQLEADRNSLSRPVKATHLRDPEEVEQMRKHATEWRIEPTTAVYRKIVQPQTELSNFSPTFGLEVDPWDRDPRDNYLGCMRRAQARDLLPHAMTIVAAIKQTDGATTNEQIDKRDRYALALSTPIRRFRSAGRC